MSGCWPTGRNETTRNSHEVLGQLGAGAAPESSFSRAWGMQLGGSHLSAAERQRQISAVSAYTTVAKDMLLPPASQEKGRARQ